MLNISVVCWLHEMMNLLCWSGENKRARGIRTYLRLHFPEIRLTPVCSEFIAPTRSTMLDTKMINWSPCWIILRMSLILIIILIDGQMAMLNCLSMFMLYNLLFGVLFIFLSYVIADTLCTYRVPKDLNCIRMVECISGVNDRRKHLRSAVAYQILVGFFDYKVASSALFFQLFYLSTLWVRVACLSYILF